MSNTHVIRAYGDDGRVILGNLDGQAVTTANYRRTAAFRYVERIAAPGGKPQAPRVAFWTVEDSADREIARVVNRNRAKA